jgi:nitroreductase
MHCVDACYDFGRYLRYSNSLVRSSNDRQKLESLLFFNYHKVEKALALPDVRPLFGLGYIGTLIALVERWVDLTGDLDAVSFRGAYAALSHYRDHVGEALAQARPDLARRLHKLLADYADAVRAEDLALGGTTLITTEDLQKAQTVPFDRLVRSRHSVRIFAPRAVPDSAVAHAVELAKQSPSVCNRQCWRVHVFTSEADKTRALQHQNGNAGFGHLAARVLLISADLRCFLTSGERHQAYTDAGMFAMTLLYALHAQGISSCCLNTCSSLSQEEAFRRDCRIPKWEVPVMLVLIGYPPDSLPVATSARVSTEHILSFRDLEGEGQANRSN